MEEEEKAKMKAASEDVENMLALRKAARGQTTGERLWLWQLSTHLSCIHDTGKFANAAASLMLPPVDGTVSGASSPADSGRREDGTTVLVLPNV